MNAADRRAHRLATAPLDELVAERGRLNPFQRGQIVADLHRDAAHVTQLRRNAGQGPSSPWPDVWIAHQQLRHAMVVRFYEAQLQLRQAMERDDPTRPVGLGAAKGRVHKLVQGVAAYDYALGMIAAEEAPEG